MTNSTSFFKLHQTRLHPAVIGNLSGKLHANWPMDRDYKAPPTRGKLVSIDPALLVRPPKGLEVGYVPIRHPASGLNQTSRFE